MIRHLFKTGNSVVLSLPQEILDSLGLSVGESITLEMDKGKKRAIITPVEKVLPTVGIDQEFSSLVTDFIMRYRSALEELAK
jgi:antitoxin MazE